MKYEIKTIKNNLGEKILIKPEKLAPQDSYERIILRDENLNYLPSKMKINYEEKAYEYDVKGQTLENYVKEHKLTKNDIIYLIEDINNVLNETENYLLSENSIILDLKAICKNGEKNLFTLAPNINLDFSYELSKFIVRILRFVDVNDKEALGLTYGLFVRSSKDNYTITDLLELVNNYQLELFNNYQLVEAYNEK